MRDESIRLVPAFSHEEVEKFAMELGKSLEQFYENDDGNIIYLVIASVIYIQDICEELLEHGIEIYLS